MNKKILSVISFFCLKRVLKSRLMEVKEELSQIPFDEEVTNMIDKISSSIHEDGEKTELLKLLLEARTLLGQRVPCYFEHGRIPTEDERLKETGTSCFNCTNRSCVFHSWLTNQPTESLSWFCFNLKFQPNH